MNLHDEPPSARRAADGTPGACAAPRGIAAAAACRAVAASVVVAALAGCAIGRGDASDAPPLRPVQVKILALNDYHGNLQSPGSFGQNTAVPPAERPPVGGADYLRAYVHRVKQRHPHTVVVGAGDFIGASPLVSALFHDEPSVESLNRIGLDLTAVGNHEFDKGRGELLRLQHGGCKTVGGMQDPNSCRGATVGTPVPFEGAHFQWLSANVIDTATGSPLLPAYAMREFDGAKVAFIGMTLKGTPTIVTPSGIAGLEFRDEADTVNALVPRLRREGADAIVVLVHQGGVQSGALADLNGCDGDLVGSDLAQIVRRLDDAVDLVVSGHTHAAYNCSADTQAVVRQADGSLSSTRRPTGLPNAAGRAVPATSAANYGRVLTEIDLTIDRRARRVTAVRAQNRLVDRRDADATAAVEADPSLRNLVGAYAGLVSPIANRVIGSIARALPATTDAAGNMPAGELVADSQLAATRAANAGGAVVALMNPGGVRAPGFTYPSSAAGEGDGNVTYGEAFTAQPFGNSLVTLTLTAQQLKDVLEQQFAGCRGQASQRILVPSAGLTYGWDATQGCGARVRGLRLVDPGGSTVDEIVDAAGRLLQPAKTYRVTVNSYLASGGDGFTVFAAGRDAQGGPQDIDALADYLSAFRAPKPPYDPASVQPPRPRITRLP